MEITLDNIIETLRLNIIDKQAFMNEMEQSDDPVKKITANFIALNISDLLMIYNDLVALQHNSPPGA